MPRCVAASWIMLMLLWHVGCAPTPLPRPSLLPIKGIVLMDGQPMPEGEILFSVEGEPVQTLKITKGAFTGEAHQGSNKVEIYLWKAAVPPATGKANVVPLRYSYNSTLKVEVPAGGSSDLKFSITAN